MALKHQADTDCYVANEYGTCYGKRLDTPDGLTQCDAPTPQQESCNDLDDNRDGKVDPEGSQGCVT